MTRVALAAAAVWTLVGPAAHAQDRPTARATVFPATFDVVNTFVAGQQIDIEKPEISAAIACFESAGVRDFNLSVPIEGIDVTPADGQLTVAVRFGTIGGYDMDLFAIDKADDDMCSDLEGALRFIELRDGVFTATVAMSAHDGQVDLSFVSTPTLTGDIDMDIEWAPDWAKEWGWDDLFPDDLLLSLLEDDILEVIGAKAEELAPTLIDQYLEDIGYETTIGKLGVDVVLDELFLSERGVTAGAAVELDWEGLTRCEPGIATVELTGAAPPLGVSSTEDDAAGVAISERFVNDMANQLWSDGFFCLTSDDVDELVATMLPDVENRPGGITGRLELEAPPAVAFDGDAVVAQVPGARIVLSGSDSGNAVTLLDMSLDVAVTAGVALDPDTSQIAVTILDLDVGVEIYETNHLIVDSDESRANFEEFLEVYVPTVAQSMVSEVFAVGSVFRAMEFAVRVQSVHLDGGSAEATVGLFHESDPVVDNEAPVTSAELIDADEVGITVALDATDDRDGAIAWKYRLNRGEWSGWTSEDLVEVPVTASGIHSLEVVARDAWLNEDPSAFHLTFDRDDVLREYAAVGCSAAPSVPAGVVLALLPLLGLVRRRR